VVCRERSRDRCCWWWRRCGKRRNEWMEILEECTTRLDFAVGSRMKILEECPTRLDFAVGSRMEILEEYSTRLDLVNPRCESRSSFLCCPPLAHINTNNIDHISRDITASRSTQPTNSLTHSLTHRIAYLTLSWVAGPRAASRGRWPCWCCSLAEPPPTRTFVAASRCTRHDLAASLSLWPRGIPTNTR